MKFDPLRYRAERAVTMSKVRKILQRLVKRLPVLSEKHQEFVEQIAEQTCMGHIECAPISDTQIRWLQKIAKKELEPEEWERIL